MKTVVLDAPTGIAARLGWDPAVSVHDRRRIIAKELVAERLGCEPREVQIVREAPRGFGYHTQLIASHDGQELPIKIHTASFRAATVVAISDPETVVGLDIRDLHPEDADLAVIRKHSHLFDENNVLDLVDHWTRVQAVLEADGRGMRVAADHVRLDMARRNGWIPDRARRYAITDLSRDGWVITLAHAPGDAA